MKASVIDGEMNDYFMQLNEAEKKSVVAMIKTFLQSRNNWPTNPDIDDYNKEIDEAVAEVERGEYYTHDEVLTMSKNW